MLPFIFYAVCAINSNESKQEGFHGAFLADLL